MSRGENGEMRNVNSAVDTINAAATAIASAESRVPPSSVQKRRWSSCWSIYWCFGSQKNSKKFGHAVLVPEPTSTGNGTTAAPTESATQQPASRVPFVAPPSSPASFLPSEPQSALQSPAGSVGLNSHSPNMYSPGGPRSMFAIGPYANETQLVTPPVFSTYNTEPSTAPYTPPPESVHLTTPSSPEVPFAQLLDPIHRNGDVGQRFHQSHYDFQSYLLHPGSTSSPFPDPYFPDIRYGVPQKLLTLEVGPRREWGSQQASGTVTPDAIQKSRDRNLLGRQDSVVSELPNLPNGHRNNDFLVDHRVSFELTSEDVVRCVEKKPTALPKALQNPDDRDYNANDSVDDSDNAETSEKEQEGQRHHKQRAASLGSIKEFNFDHVNGLDSNKPCINSNWWANEKVVGSEDGPCKNWSFFPVMQPGVS
ncbi:hypothetical protein RDABS01_027629 [Bienertia sinuspersici]